MHDERNTISRVLNGDLKAFSSFIERYEQLVYSISSELIKDPHEVQDVAQEVFIRVFKGLKTFKSNSAFSTWIAKIAYNTSITHLKRKRRNAAILESFETQNHVELSDPQALVDNREMAAYVRNLINDLREDYRTVILLFHVHGFNYKQISDVTGLPEGTVKTSLFRARKILKEKMIMNFTIVADEKDNR